ncbi:MAG: ABC transporter ATP-binding protein [Oscillospiraceae bacterium]|jgi:peptide/nickel transport system ATP-binding protein
MSNILEVRDLEVRFNTQDGCVHAVNKLSFDIGRGEALGLVGETGAGKTTTALSILHLISVPPGEYAGGSIRYNDVSILDAPESELRKIRGNHISMIFQDPMTALNPVIRVADQIAEVIKLHEDCPSAQACEKANEMLELVGIPAARGTEYPHQFSGGMKQRVVIAMALACSPNLLLADEPTTALDVTIQAQVLDLIRSLRTKFGTSMLLITHDLGVVAETCDKVAIMYAGEIVEYGTLERIFHNVKHPYSAGLFGSLPSLNKKVRRLSPISGLMPDPTKLPKGCMFSPRCPYASAECKAHHPELVEIEPGHLVRCIKVEGGEKI